MSAQRVPVAMRGNESNELVLSDRLDLGRLPQAFVPLHPPSRFELG